MVHMGVPPSPDDEVALLDAHTHMTRPTGCPLGPRLPLQGGYVAVGLTRGPTLCILRGPQPSRSTRGMAREHRGWLDPLRFRTPPGSWHRVPHGAGGSTFASGTFICLQGRMRRPLVGEGSAPRCSWGTHPLLRIGDGNAMAQGGMPPCDLTPFGSWCQ